jgi:hypothetical protein
VFGDRPTATRLRRALRLAAVTREVGAICEWTQLGRHAYGHTRDGRLAGVLYWDPAEPACSADGNPVVVSEGFYFVHAERAGEHHHVMDGPESKDGWMRALERASANLSRRRPGAGAADGP